MKKSIFAFLTIFITVITNAQNVGIGTANPTRLLHVRDSVNPIANLLLLQGIDPYISFYDNNGVYKSYIWDTGPQLQIGTTGSGSTISINPNFTANTTFFSNGNVSIGSAIANARLDIDAGNANEIIRMNSTGYPYLSLHKSGAQKGFYGLVQGNGGSVPDHLQISSSTGSNLPLRFYTNGSLRMTIAENNLVQVGGSGEPVSLDVFGFTRLGDPSTSPRIQIIKLTGSTATTQGGLSQIFHGITNTSKILAISVLVQNPSGEYIPPNHTSIFGRQFDFLVTNNYVEIYNDAANSSIILNRPVKILITLEE